ncbi:DNA topoisomerase IV subunit A [Paenibacillus sp. TRM 82003]|uniref:DNA gyrase/topoisomerase IV subunit A n=1 Tax=Kineococcus sp. TRM81007 TaxID=2925831 RepID=UPI001F55E1FF|nr:DNA topoisomerase IV subunit A [Kineococcus sp. TRM81007]MCI2240386.1 DNA topoisomerase IV subunit A [Kineococcus sp. TRM81007]MCI3927438.1 DNA topoisomerase IV subunit A [Paenibacillus sp. TRM 82003]
MARRTSPPPPPDAPERIVDIDVEQEMQGAFLEYAYSVIYSRALPDARDGLKPVQRRILYMMQDMGLTPERAHVKSARVVGEVMGKLHPHGDVAIYDALVRQAQPFTMRVPLVDGHGNFGSLDAGPAAQRYTEARPAPAALLMTTGLDEDVVDFVANYDDRLKEPGVLPAAFPNLLVNGASGIAVGMATNMPPHNLGEVIAAARHLLKHPDADLPALMRFVPGPDFPTGGKVVGLEGIRDAYASGRGTFRTRAAVRVENVTARRKGIVVTELPYGVGPERLTEKIADNVKAKRLQGVADVVDLSDRTRGLHLVIEVKNGFVPEAVLEQLYRLTPMEETFGINNVALVDGQPRTLGLKELLEVFIAHRVDVVRRRTAYRLRRREERLHLVDGLLVAILDIDEVIAIVRSSDDAAAARARLTQVFDLSETQAAYILDMQLRRLTKFSRIELEREQAELNRQIAELRAILSDEGRLRKLVGDELAQVAAEHGTPRRTVLLTSSGPATGAVTALEVADDPCTVLMSSTGLLARTDSAEPLGTEGRRTRHDLVVSTAPATARGHVGVVTSAGRLVRLPVLDLPVLPPTNGRPSLSGGVALKEFLTLAKGERALGLVPLPVAGVEDPDDPGFALATASGVVKRLVLEPLGNREEVDVIALKDVSARKKDEVVAAVQLRTGEEDLVFITSDAQLLRFSASLVRPQGRGAAGVAGVRLSPGAQVVSMTAVDADEPDAVVVTVAGDSGALPGTQLGSAKVTPLSEYPAKGRATGGVRCHRFARGEDVLLLAWAGRGPAEAATPTGTAVALPEAPGRRDGSGTALDKPAAAIAGPPLL